MRRSGNDHKARAKKPKKPRPQAVEHGFFGNDNNRVSQAQSIQICVQYYRTPLIIHDVRGTSRKITNLISLIQQIGHACIQD